MLTGMMWWMWMGPMRRRGRLEPRGHVPHRHYHRHRRRRLGLPHLHQPNKHRLHRQRSMHRLSNHPTLHASVPHVLLRGPCLAPLERRRPCRLEPPQDLRHRVVRWPAPNGPRCPLRPLHPAWVPSARGPPQCFTLKGPRAATTPPAAASSANENKSDRTEKKREALQCCWGPHCPGVRTSWVAHDRRWQEWRQRGRPPHRTRPVAPPGAARTRRGMGSWPRSLRALTPCPPSCAGPARLAWPRSRACPSQSTLR